MTEAAINAAIAELIDRNKWTSDLNHILQFQTFKNQENTNINGYLNHFGAFTNEFRVNRGLGNNAHVHYLEVCIYEMRQMDLTLVDRISVRAKQKGVTNGYLDSLASKVCMLSNPLMYYPMDSRSKTALGLSSNNFLRHTELIKLFISQHENQITTVVEDLAIQLKSNEESLLWLKARFIDKYLWVCGDPNNPRPIFK